MEGDDFIFLLSALQVREEKELNLCRYFFLILSH